MDVLSRTQNGVEPVSGLVSQPTHPLNNIERLSIDIITAWHVSDESTASAWDNLAEDHRSRYLDKYEYNTREGFVAFRSGLGRMSPRLRVDVLEAVSETDELKATAKVWLTVRLSQYELPNMGPRESVVTLDWKRRGCRAPRPGWVCVRSNFMHGYWD